MMNKKEAIEFVCSEVMCTSLNIPCDLCPAYNNETNICDKPNVDKLNEAVCMLLNIKEE